MTKWPVQKPTHRKTQTHVEHRDAQYRTSTGIVLQLGPHYKLVPFKTQQIHFSSK